MSMSQHLTAVSGDKLVRETKTDRKIGDIIHVRISYGSKFFVTKGEIVELHRRTGRDPVYVNEIYVDETYRVKIEGCPYNLYAVCDEDGGMFPAVIGLGRWWRFDGGVLDTKADAWLRAVKLL